jgi:hypothetical protein
MNWTPIIIFLLTCLFFAIVAYWVRNSKGSPWKWVEKLLKDDRDEREAERWVRNQK